MAVQERLYTVDDLANMPDDGKIYELHNGVIVEVAGSKLRQTLLASWIIHLLFSYVEQQELGGAVGAPDGAAALNQYNTRIPDVSYLKAERLNAAAMDEYIQGAPDLAVEVVSPSNSDAEMQQRAGEYLAAGASLVWIVNPAQRMIDVYRPDGSITHLDSSGVLEGDHVLPGLALPVSRVFEQLRD